MEALAAPGVFNFLASAIESPPSDPRLRNTIEIFSLGTLLHYHRHRDHCLDLDATLAAKLLQLTLISISNECDGLKVPITQLAEQYGIPTTVELDRAIIYMVDHKYVDMTIAGDSLVIGPALVYRDSYDPEIYQLQLLSEEEVAARSVPLAKDNLQHWFDHQVAPLRQEFVASSKKRKPSQ
ncbi:hypothetical protein DIURU_001386 [Diutina rugosa]|uniref:PCI domain-containing protein n=1 Tax=Diutina rugosa TaxID=5481 RepID=A0A642UUU2_DIURU|nr:uncharacterized protein DIURU_001386 [Diutina rugosa]KAA8905724.1 hypothetical protein DIURU_001386 [Diutina rugosa]